jgi:hypothetical protein
MMSFEISTKWIQATSDLKRSEDDATLAQLLMTLADVNITKFRDDYSREISSHLEVPAYFLAEWIAENWWPLLWEPRKNEDDEPDPEFMSRHSLLAAQHGFALPKLLLLPIGRSIQLSASARNVSLADVRFLNGAMETFPRDQVEVELRTFVNKVVARLEESRISDTYLQDAWQLVIETTSDEVQFCQFVGALGKSPYDIDERTASLIERLLPTLGERLLMDLCLASTAASFEATAKVAESAVAMTKDAVTSTLSPLSELAVPQDNMSGPAYRRGVSAANLLRSRFNIKDTDPAGATRILEMLKLDTGRRSEAIRKDDEIVITGAVVREDLEMKVALLQSTEAKRRFAGARAIFSAWSAETPNEHRLLTSAVTRDQQANRAFAAEITAPRNLLRVKARKNGRLSQDEVFDLAADLRIGPDVVKKQALNNGIQVSP